MNRLKRAGLLMPEKGPQIAIPTSADPTKAARVVPAKFFLSAKPDLNGDKPYRPALAAWLTSPDNPFFAKATANRLWAEWHQVRL